jgi:predicted aspartyl protease
MAQRFEYEPPFDDEVIIVEATISKRFTFRLALDTAATHTTLDSNMLFMAGFELKNSNGEVEIETSNGIVVVETYTLDSFSCLGNLKQDFEVQVYDFLAHGILSDYHGIVGLDFLRDIPFCINIAEGWIDIN